MYIFVPPQLSVTVKSFGNDWVEGRNWIGAEQGGRDDFWAGNFRERRIIRLSARSSSLMATNQTYQIVDVRFLMTKS